MARLCCGCRMARLVTCRRHGQHSIISISRSPSASTWWYDSRGSGLSDREAIDFSMDAMVRDLQAVVESAGLTGFAMSALADAVPIAVTYAAIRPEKISSLVLVDGWTKYSDYHQNPAAIVAEEALRSGDWKVYTETLARVLVGFE